MLQRGRLFEHLVEVAGVHHADSGFVRVQTGSGGKLHVFLSSRPSAGAHALLQRDAPVGAGSKEALTIMAPVGKDYKDLAIAAADAQVRFASSSTVNIAHGQTAHETLHECCVRVFSSSGWTACAFSKANRIWFQFAHL